MGKWWFDLAFILLGMCIEYLWSIVALLFPRGPEGH